MPEVNFCSARGHLRPIGGREKSLRPLELTRDSVWRGRESEQQLIPPRRLPSSRARLDRIYAVTGRPILIGEFHMGTPGRGMSAGLVTVRDQAQRGVAYRYYVENAFAMPALIGAR